MADRYWVGGTASWDGTAGAKWALTSGGAGGEAVPTTADDVFFDAASGAVTVTVGASSACLDIDFTGFTGTFAGSSALEVRGSWIGDAGVTRTYNGTVTFSATDSRTITSNGMALDGALTFNGSGGTWALQDNLTTGATRATTLTTGTLDINGQVLSTGTFSSSNSNVRTLDFGAGTLQLTGASALTVIGTNTATNLTVTGGGLISITGSTASDRTIQGGAEFGVQWPDVSVSAGSGGLTIQRFNCASYTQTSGYTGIFTIGSGTGGLTTRGGFVLDPANGTPTSTGQPLTFAATSGTVTPDFGGKTMDVPITVNAPGATVELAANLTMDAARALTISAGTFDLGAFDASAGTFSISGSTTRAITGSGDILLTNASGTTTVVNMGADTNLTLSGWSGSIRMTGANSSARTIAGDATSTGVTLPPISVEAGSGGVTLTNVLCTSYTQTSGYTGILTLGTGGLTTGAISLNAANGIPAASANALTLTGTGTPDFAGKATDFPVTINAPGATVTLGAALNIAARALTLTAGTFDADTYAVTAGSLDSSNSNTRTLDLGSGTWTLSATGTAWNCATATNLTLTAGTSTVACTDPDVTFAGGGKTYNVVRFARGGTVAITGSNTFGTLALA